VSSQVSGLGDDGSSSDAGSDDDGSRGGRGSDVSQSPKRRRIKSKHRRSGHGRHHRRASYTSDDSASSDDGYDSADLNVDEGVAAAGAAKTARGAGGISLDNIALRVSPSWRVEDVQRHPDRLAAFIQTSNSECVASVDRGIAAIQQRLQQTEAASVAAAGRVDAVDASIGQLKDMLGSVVTAMQQQMSAQQAATAHAMQQLQQAVTLHQQVLRQQQVLQEQQEQLHASRVAKFAAAAAAVVSSDRPTSPARLSVSSAPASVPPSSPAPAIQSVPLRMPPYDASELERAVQTTDNAVTSAARTLNMDSGIARVTTAHPRQRPAVQAGRRSSVPLLGFTPHAAGSTLVVPQQSSVGTSWSAWSAQSAGAPPSPAVASGGSTSPAPPVTRGTTIP
jgi:hypothetical protein